MTFPLQPNPIDEERIDTKGITFKVDDHADLWQWCKLVGKGIVSVVGRDATCHNIPLPQGCVRVNIVNAIVGDYRLPYPSLGIDTVKDCVGSFAIWKFSDLMGLETHYRPVLKGFVTTTQQQQQLKRHDYTRCIR